MFWDPQTFFSVWNKEELPEQWKECVILSIKGWKSDSSSYIGISLFIFYVQKFI
jgi:hypothetical protein